MQTLRILFSIMVFAPIVLGVAGLYVWGSYEVFLLWKRKDYPSAIYWTSIWSVLTGLTGFCCIGWT